MLNKRFTRLFSGKSSALYIIAASLFTGVIFNGCLGSDSKDGGSNTPDNYVCKQNDTLCVSRATLITQGEQVFSDMGCTGCHGADARGGSEGAPPQANSDYFMAVRLRPVRILLKGLSDTIRVNGQVDNGFMPSLGQSMSNQEIAAVLTFLRVQRNDSTVVSCTETGCIKTPRSVAEIAMDSIAVWEVKRIRDSLNAL